MQFLSCLSPINIVNPHYKKIAQYDVYKEFGYRVDFRFDVPCGRCILCKKRYSSQWRYRLKHEWQFGNHDPTKCWFVTLTISPQFYHDALVNSSKLIRNFLENYRYQTRKRFGRAKEHSLFHWIVSERGEEKGRLHFHGLLFDVDLPRSVTESCWKYGFVKFRKLTLGRVIYCTKYITKGSSPKSCKASRHHQPRVWCSAGIGKSFVTAERIKFHTNNGVLIPFVFEHNRQYAMPRYYKGKIFNEEQKQILYEQWVSQLELAPTPPYCIGQLKFDNWWSFYRKQQELLNKYPLLPIDEERRKKRLANQFRYKQFNYPNLQIPF